MFRHRQWAAGLGLALAAVALPAAGQGLPEPSRGIAVIAHPARKITLGVEELAQIYLRRRNFWSDGSGIVPLNLPSGAELRSRFTQGVLRQPEARLADYWNRRYFDGIFPPATLASPQAVLRYVASDPQAIGYIPAAEVNSSVRVVLRLE